MNKQKTFFWENYYLQKIRFANRGGSHKNCIRVFKNNTYIHEKTKFDICWKLIEGGYSVWTECIFTSGQRADIVALKGKEAYVVEVETPKSPKEMERKLSQKLKYPEGFALVIVNTKEFDIETFKL